MINTSEIPAGRIRGLECAKEGWEKIKSDYWLLLAITIVGVMISGATLYIIGGAMLCGILGCYLKKIDGQPVKFEDLFKGFQYFGPGLVILLIAIVPTIIVYGIIYFPILAIALFGRDLGQSSITGILIAGGVVDLIAVVGIVCFHSLLMFAFPLIVDRGLGPIDAVRTSASAVWKNLGGVASLIGINFLLTLAGMLVFCIGIYLAVPLMLAANVVAYRRLFPARGAGFDRPPEPHKYPNL